MKKTEIVQKGSYKDIDILVDGKLEVKVPKVEMKFNQILTSAIITHKVNGIVIDNLLPKQIVVAAGPNAQVSVGDVVELNTNNFPRDYKTPTHGIGDDIVKVLAPVEKINDVPYLYVSDREIKWIYRDNSSDSYKLVKE